MKYDIIIIGGGPGGIYSAYELVKGNPALKIALFEAGHPLEKRHCPIDGEKVKSCVGCKSCEAHCPQRIPIPKVMKQAAEKLAL